MSIEDSVNFRRIDERLTTSGVVGPERLANLRAEGYGAVINLLPDTSEYAVENEAAILAAQGVDYVHIPVDFAAPTGDDLQAFADAMDQRSGAKIHVHCAANYRVSAFYALYAMHTGRWNRRQADDFVHDVWNPDEHPPWQAFIAEHRAPAT